MIDKAGNCKGKIAVYYKPKNSKWIIPSSKRQNVFEFLLKNNNKEINAKTIITSCSIVAKDPYKTLYTYIGELNTLIRKLHQIPGRKQFIIWRGENIMPQIPE